MTTEGHCEICGLVKGVSYGFCGRGQDGAGADDATRCYLRGYERQKGKVEKLKAQLAAATERARAALRIQYDIEEASGKLRALLSGREV